MIKIITGDGKDLFFSEAEIKYSTFLNDLFFTNDFYHH